MATTIATPHIVTRATDKERPNGGKREGSGRPKGTRNKRTEENRQLAASTGMTPLEFMLKNMRRPMPRKATEAQKLAHLAFTQQAARDAAPYVHARLSAVQVSGGLKLNHETALDELE